VKAVDYLLSKNSNESVCDIFNLGTGNGYSVLDMINAFTEVTGQTVKYKIAPRRAGDIAECYANPALAYRSLHWKAEKNLQDMMADTWRWQKNNPCGYE
jgi:UDP-glucose 4-epimerase